MKKQFLLTPVLLAGAMAFAAPAHADLLSFNGYNDGDTAFDKPPGKVNTTRGSTFSPSPVVTTGGLGSTINATGNGNIAAVPAGEALELDNFGTASNQNKSLTFSVSTVGYGNLQLDFAQQQFGNGFNSTTVQYSTDGTTFTTFGTYTPTAGSYSLESFNFNSIGLLNDNANARFRLIFGGGATTAGANGNYLDNVSISGVLTPEPSTWAMMGLGIGAIAFLKRRKKRESGTASFAGALA